MAEIPNFHLTIYNTIANSKQPIKLNQILDKLGYDKSQKRLVRNAIKELIIDYGMPIGTKRGGVGVGYFIIKDKDQLDIALNTMKSVIETLNKRYETIKNLEVE